MLSTIEGADTSAWNTLLRVYSARGIGTHGLWKNRKRNTLHKVDVVFAGWCANVS